MTDWSWRIARHCVHTCGATQHEAELAPLLDLIRDSRVILELGTLRGGTFHALCWAADPEALCVSIDLPLSPDEPTLTPAGLASHAQSGQHVVQIIGDTHDPTTQAMLRTALKGRRIDALFIDADHHYVAVKQDHDDYSPLVRSGGIIAFHDIARSSSYQAGCEVDRYWAELQDSWARTDATRALLGPERWEFVVEDGCMGIGAYRKP